MQVERTGSDALVVNELPDGSRILVDSTNEKVFALNATAGAAWDACSGSTSLSRVAAEMQRSFNPGVTQEVAEEAILRLQEKKLVRTSEPLTTRRQLIATLGAVALPLVVSLTMSEQQAHALQARSAICPPKPKPHPQPTHWFSR